MSELIFFFHFTEVDIQDFDPEDLDICVEGSFLIIKGEREVKRGSNVSKRVFNQKFNLPSGVDVDKITSTFKLNGKLVVSIPQIASEAAVKEGEPKVEASSNYEKKTLADGTVVEMSSSRKTSSSSHESVIPITFGDMPKMTKSPRPRLMPFAFPELPEMPEFSAMPSLMPGMPSMPSMSMQMPSADEMMAKMQAQMQAQMQQMQNMQMMQMPPMMGNLQPMMMIGGGGTLKNVENK